MRPSPSSDLSSLLKLSALRPSIQDLQLKKKAVSGSSAWMRIDPEGNSMMIEADKYAIMHRVGIHARDLRILDPLLTYPSTILGRERAIVVNLESIKAIVTADEVLLRNSESEEVIPFIEKLKWRLAPAGIEQPTNSEGKAGELDLELSEEDEKAETLPLKQNVKRQKSRSPSPVGISMQLDSFDVPEEDGPAPPFEFVALEVALDFVCTNLDSCTTQLEDIANPALDALTLKISSLNLERVRKLKAGLSRLSARVEKVREEVEQLLDDDGDMAEMFLTRKLAVFHSGSQSPSPSAGNSPSLNPAPTIGSRVSLGLSQGTFSSLGDDEDVEELEQLLEAYCSQVEGTSNRLNSLREYINDTEDYINIQLDSRRNQLIQVDLVLNAGITMVAVYSVIVGMFGVNIPYAWNNEQGSFTMVVVFATVFCLLGFGILVGYAKLRKIVS